ncbi:MAG: hypothetical protein RMJ33_11190 [Saprospiraceae bacterium]|nr:hypothetical protein [Saprospiraceae bacterium]MDW8230392.1 hypothetical protein [Saprospiraceae bacterium]
MQKNYRNMMLALLLCVSIAGYQYVERDKQARRAQAAQAQWEIAEQKASLFLEQLLEANQQIERYQALQASLRDFLRANGQALNKDLKDSNLLARLNQLFQKKNQEIGALAYNHTQTEDKLEHLEHTLEQLNRQRSQEQQHQDSLRCLLQALGERHDSLQNELAQAMQHWQNTQIDTLSFLSPKGVEVSFLGRLVYGEPSGFGIGFYKERGYYIGHWKGVKRHGKGKHFHLNGDTYEGEFVEDVRQGYGRYVFASGEVYEGEWQNDLMHGKGRITFKNGSAKSGIWVEGKMKENN